MEIYYEQELKEIDSKQLEEAMKKEKLKNKMELEKRKMELEKRKMELEERKMELEEKIVNSVERDLRNSSKDRFMDLEVDTILHEIEGDLHLDDAFGIEKDYSEAEKIQAEADRILATKGIKRERGTNSNFGHEGREKPGDFYSKYMGAHDESMRSNARAADLAKTTDLKLASDKIKMLKEIEELTSNVRMPEIEAETQAIRTERTQERDNNIEERGE